MSVFTLNNGKTELIAKEKLLSWWHLIDLMEVKATLYMEKVQLLGLEISGYFFVHDVRIQKWFVICFYTPYFPR